MLAKFNFLLNDFNTEKKAFVRKVEDMTKSLKKN